MGFIALTATLTTAGKNLIDTADSQSNKLAIDRISFGSATANVTVNTTSIGTVLETTRYLTNSTNLDKTKAMFQCLFVGQSTNTAGTVGLYIGSVLVAAVRLTLPSNAGGYTQVGISFSYGKCSVFSTTPSTVAASLLSELYANSVDTSMAYVLGGGISGQRALFGHQTEEGHNLRESDFFCNFVNIFETKSDFNLPATIGTSAYYLRDFRRYVMIASGWGASGGTVVSDLKPGRFYRSDMTNSLYYVRSPGDLVKVATG